MALWQPGLFQVAKFLHARMKGFGRLALVMGRTSARLANMS